MQTNQLKLESLLKESRVGKKLTNGLEIAKLYAISRNGLCHSTEYINVDSKLAWSCEDKEHLHWEASYSKVVNGGRWCPKCSKEKLALQYKNKEGLCLAQKHAQNRGGECLSKEYTNARIKLEWICHNPKHKSWFADFNSVVTSGSWCPDCGKNRNIQENRVRNILNEVFNTEFISCKLNWNINPETGRMLELDGYSESLAIAFEYQGEQHFLTSNINSQEDLEYLQRRDKYKKENCQKNHIKLIVVNYIKNGNNFEELLKEIKRALIDANIKNIDNFNEKKLKELFNKTTGSNLQNENFIRTQEYAQSKGGTCLSTEYINASSHMEWKCEKENHPAWFSSYNSIVNSQAWCSKCGDTTSSEKQRNPYGLEEAINYAQSKGGKCLSTNYINNKSKIEWKCHNHTHSSWFAKFENVIDSDTWCPECAGNKKLNGLVIAKNYAKTKKGKCLSTQYKNNKTKLEWKCQNSNHSSFNKSLEHVISRNQWCPECYKENRSKNN